jgi:hypothetical protein
LIEALTKMRALDPPLVPSGSRAGNSSVRHMDVSHSSELSGDFQHS